MICKILVAVFLAFCFSVSAQNRLTNGSFEDGYGTCGIATQPPCFPAASCAFCEFSEAPLGWTWISGNIDLFQSGVFNSDFINGVADGKYALDMNGYVPGDIKQTVTGLNVGKKAVLSLRFGSNSAGPGIFSTTCPASLNKPLRITVRDASNAVIFIQDIATGAFDVRAGLWGNFVADFIATTTSATLEFESLFNDTNLNCAFLPTQSYFGPSLDNIYLGLPPEICNNGIDDDGDGLVDKADIDCVCIKLAVRDTILCAQTGSLALNAVGTNLKWYADAITSVSTSSVIPFNL